MAPAARSGGCIDSGPECFVVVQFPDRPALVGNESLPISRLIGTYRGSRDDRFGLHSQASFNTGSADPGLCQSRPRWPA
jgi:hypothetical protein